MLIYNPYHVIKYHFEQGKVNDAAYNALTSRALEIRATDLDDDIKELMPSATRRPGESEDAP